MISSYRCCYCFCIFLLLARILLAHPNAPRQKSLKPIITGKEFHKITLAGQTFNGSGMEPLLDLASFDSSIFVFHGSSGAGKSSMVETLCFPHDGTENISGPGSDHKTVQAQSYKILGGTTAITVIDTPGFGETGSDRTRIYESMDQVRTMVGKRPIQQIYYFALIGDKTIKNRLKALQNVYGRDIVKYVTLVFSKGDQLRRLDKDQVSTMLDIFVTDLSDTFDHPFTRLVVSSKAAGPRETCFIQLTEHMASMTKNKNAIMMTMTMQGTSFKDQMAIFSKRISHWTLQKEKLSAALKAKDAFKKGKTIAVVVGAIVITIASVATAGVASSAAASASAVATATEASAPEIAAVGGGTLASAFIKILVDKSYPEAKKIASSVEKLFFKSSKELRKRYKTASDKLNSVKREKAQYLNLVQ